jgi:transposase
MKIKVQAAQGVPLTRIAAEQGIDRKTARKLRDAPAEPGVTLRRRPSRLEGYADWIGERLGAGVPAAELVRDLARRGVLVPYPTLRDFARKLRPARDAAAVEVRFETPPAKQAQCDWAECGRMLEENITFPLYLFVMVLGYSRKTFAKFTSSMDELTLQRCHAEAFAFFGGVPYSILYDNPKTITIRRNERSEPVWNRDFEEFAARYGYRPICAAPYRAKTKGKVERTIGFLRTSFFPGRSFVDVDDAQQQLDDWLAEANRRVHRTHGEVVDVRFAREAPLLLSLRAGMAIVSRTEQRIVDVEGFVSYGSNRYEMPPGQRGSTLLVHDNGSSLRFYDGTVLVCEHQRLHGKRRIALHRRESPNIPALLAVAVEQRSLTEYEDVAT